MSLHTVYITGCLGFMASRFVEKCLERKWKVFGMDKCTYAANTDLIAVFEADPNFTFLQADIRDIQYLPVCDYVVNFAAESHVGNSIIRSNDFVDTNVMGVKNLLDLVRNKPINEVNRPLFFHISTDEVYGDIASGKHVETDTLRPSNPYSASKAAGDMLVTAWARTYDLQYIILRPTNNYGIRQYPEKLIPIVVKNLRRGKKVYLHNKGRPIRNWLHIDDTADAILTVIDAGVVNETYNVSGGFEQSNAETVRKVIEAFFGTDEGWQKHISYDYNREGQDVRYALDDSKLRALGWAPQKVFDKEIGGIVDHFKRNFRW